MALLRRVVPWRAHLALQCRLSTASFKSIEDEVADANVRGKGRYQVLLTKDKGWGVFADRDISTGDLCFSARALYTLPQRDQHSVQTSWETHTHMDLPGRFINHCCTANVGIVDNAYGAFDFIALQDLSTGDELLWDYEASEYLCVSSFDCLCGSPRCRGRLNGFKYSGDIIKSQYGDHYANFLK